MKEFVTLICEERPIPRKRREKPGCKNNWFFTCTIMPI